MGKLAKKQAGDLQERIQASLDKETRKCEFGFRIVESFTQDEDILCFVVIPDKPGIRAYEYAEIMTRVETKFRKDGFNILLVPGRPD